ncbi:hypothetical protein DYB36_007145 [Aphanomyces astaci]|uniref:PDZ domain-containing protein n=1 Tax=Aphanomyces astaci TaxID=112090 RepID=A0A397F3U7_APHAT|nr:hypothetical protein DYB36_007145 [Aphanomyces astaci]RHZ14438.1 hypothetical protein DYB31_005209 [Aphanomyces astaci]
MIAIMDNSTDTAEEPNGVIWALLEDEIWWPVLMLGATVVGSHPLWSMTDPNGPTVYQFGTHAVGDATPPAVEPDMADIAWHEMVLQHYWDCFLSSPSNESVAAFSSRLDATIATLIAVVIFVSKNPLGKFPSTTMQTIHRTLVMSVIVGEWTCHDVEVMTRLPDKSVVDGCFRVLMSSLQSVMTPRLEPQTAKQWVHLIKTIPDEEQQRWNPKIRRPTPTAEEYTVDFTAGQLGLVLQTRPSGVLVGTVLPNSQASRAAVIKKGDVLIKVRGIAIKSKIEIVERFVGSTVRPLRITFRRELAE